MEIHVFVLLAGLGVLAGMVASIVGGAAVIVYPALIATGVPPQFAAASNLVALMPASARLATIAPVRSKRKWSARVAGRKKRSLPGRMAVNCARTSAPTS